MTDPKNEKFDLGSDEDFDFNKIADYESTPSSSDSGPDDFAAFGDTSSDFAFEDEKTSFPSDDDSSVFAGEFATADEFQGQESDPFDFGGPPSPESVELDSLNGDPDQEFGDFGDDTDNDFYADAEGDKPNDPFADDAADYAAPATSDPFAEPEDGDIPDEPQAEEQAAPREQSRFGIKQIATFAAVAAVVGYVGYSQVVPMFVPQDTGEQVVADVGPVIDEGALAPALPATPTNVVPTPAPVETVTEIGALAPIDEPTSAPPQLTLPGMDTQTPVEQVAAVDPKPVVDLPALDAKPAPADPIGDLVGGTDRGGIASMKEMEPVAVTAVETATPVGPATDRRIEDFARQLEEVVKRIETIEKRVADLATAAPAVRTVADPSMIAPPVATPPVAAATPGVSAPLKPPIIETAVLRGVSRDIAWIALGKDVVEVKVGDTIPDAGVVESFQNYRGRWIAVTDKGIILPR